MRHTGVLAAHLPAGNHRQLCVHACTSAWCGALHCHHPALPCLSLAFAPELNTFEPALPLPHFRLLPLQPVLTAAQLAPLHTSCCKLPHALRLQLALLREGPGGDRSHLGAMIALNSAILDVSTLVRNLLLLQVPLAGDPEAAAAWDRCVLSWQAGSAPAAAAFSLFTPPWALP